jgi:hypothetical protein
MRQTSLICPKCKELVPVVDKRIEEHGDCPVGGMRYVPSPVRFKAGPGAPEIEILATRPVKVVCNGGDGCAGEHKGIAALVKIDWSNPQVN